MVIIAHKNARFLPLYLNLYRDYEPDEWCVVSFVHQSLTKFGNFNSANSNLNRYYNAGHKPVEEVLFPHPEFIRRVDGRFDADPTTASRIYNEKDFNWRHLDTIHLLSRWFRAGELLLNLSSIHIKRKI